MLFRLRSSLAAVPLAIIGALAAASGRLVLGGRSVIVLTIGFIVVVTLALAVLELWVMLAIEERDDRRRQRSHHQSELRAGRSVKRPTKGLPEGR